MKKFDRIKKYIKENKTYILVMFIGLIAFMTQVKSVVLYADDVLLGVISKQEGIVGAFKYLCENYKTWGGGPTPFIAIIFMMFDLKVWKLANCIMIFISVVLSVRIITHNNNLNKSIIASIIWSCIFILNIYISRETIYWLDGNLAYVLTTFQLFIYFYYLYSKIVMDNKIKKYDYVLLPLFAFFSGWTGPQTAILTVLIGLILITWKKWFKKEKINWIFLLTLVFSIIGCLVEVLAPGNSGRMVTSFPEFSEYNFIERIMYRVDSIYGLIFDVKTYGFGSISLYAFIVFGIIACIAYQMSKEEKNVIIRRLIKASSIFIVSYIIAILIARLNLVPDSNIINNLFKFSNIYNEINNGTYCNNILIPYIVSSIIMLFSCILSYYISIKKKNPLLFILIISALLGQGMMVASPYSPLRSTFITVFLLWVALAYVLTIANSEKISIIFVITIVLGITKIEYGIVALIIYYSLVNFFKDSKNSKVELIITTCILIIFAAHNWLVVTKNYRANENIYYQNLSRIENFIKNGQKEKELVLLKSHYPIYGFDGFVGTPWIEESVKEYFGIKEDVILKEE